MSIIKSTNAGKGAIYHRITFNYLKSIGWYDCMVGYTNNDIVHGKPKRELCDPRLGWNYKIKMEGDNAYMLLFFGYETERHRIGYYPKYIEFDDELQLVLKYFKSSGDEEKAIAEQLFEKLKNARGIIKEIYYYKR